MLATGYVPELPYLATQPEALEALTFDAGRPGLALAGQFVVHGLPELPHYPHHALAETFAAGAGATPDEEVHAGLVEALRFGPMLPERYRLGEPGMAERFAEMTAGFRAPDEQVAAWGRLTAGGVVASVA